MMLGGDGHKKQKGLDEPLNKDNKIKTIRGSYSFEPQCLKKKKKAIEHSKAGSLIKWFNS